MNEDHAVFRDFDYLPLRCRHARREGGFSLVEVLVVVVILGILATVAVTAYGKWIGRARRGEAVAILAEMSAKETVYLTEFGAYLPLRNEMGAPVYPSPDEDANAFYPISPDAPNFDSRGTMTIISNAAGWPTGWKNVGLRPRRQELYCTYILNAGLAGDQVPVAATVGKPLFGNIADPSTSAIPTNWFYAIAACNLTGLSGFPGEVSLMMVTHHTTTLMNLNDGR